MLGVRARKKDAQKIKQYLARQKLMANNYNLISSDEFIYFPITCADRGRSRDLPGLGTKVVNMDFEPVGEKSDYRKKLHAALGKSYDSVAKGYELLGDVALINASSKRIGKEMAKVIMEINKNVKTVLSKGPVFGRYRVRKYSYVAGRRKYTALYKENGASFNIDVRSTFFSTRLGFERARVCRLVKDGENVMVMFAGIGPFAIEIGKAHRGCHVVGIELNRRAYKSMVENIKLNKLDNVDAKLGDVSKEVANYRNFADRIIMPLPKESHKFLESALLVSKKRCTVHYYAFGSKGSGFSEQEDMLRSFFKGHGRRFKVLNRREVRPYSAREIEMGLDFQIY